MLPKWTGEIVAKLHCNGISQTEMANEMGLTKNYISMILNGTKNPAGIKDRMNRAIDRIIEKRKEQS